MSLKNNYQHEDTKDTKKHEEVQQNADMFHHEVHEVTKSRRKAKEMKIFSVNGPDR